MSTGAISPYPVISGKQIVGLDYLGLQADGQWPGKNRRGTKNGK